MIEVTELRRSYRVGEIEVQALRDVSFRVERGEFVAIMGPSGSGKSTLLHLLGCLDSPDGGQYRLDGQPVEQLPGDGQAAVRNRKIGFVFQQFNLLPRLTALGNVELPLIYRGMRWPAERRLLAMEALEAVGLSDRMQHRPRELSGGQQQRVAIARALVTRPALLLADEPTGNLDSHASAEIMALLHTLHEAGLTVVLVTHERALAQRAGRILTIHDGRLTSDQRLRTELRATPSPAPILEGVSHGAR